MWNLYFKRDARICLFHLLVPLGWWPKKMLLVYVHRTEKNTIKFKFQYYWVCSFLSIHLPTNIPPEGGCRGIPDSCCFPLLGHQKRFCQTKTEEPLSTMHPKLPGTKIKVLRFAQCYSDRHLSLSLKTRLSYLWWGNYTEKTKHVIWLTKQEIL